MKRPSIFISLTILSIFLLVVEFNGCKASSQTENIEPCIRAGKLAYQKKNYKGAIEVLENCLNSLPKTHKRYADIYALIMDGYDQWGKDLLETGAISDAIVCFKKEISLIEKSKRVVRQLRIADVYLSLALAYYYSLRYDDAIAAANRVITFLVPEKEALTYWILGKCYSAKGKIAKAKEFIEKLKALKEDRLAGEIEAQIQTNSNNYLTK